MEWSIVRKSGLFIACLLIGQRIEQVPHGRFQIAMAKLFSNFIDRDWKGRMVTGLQEIDGKLYYFETEAGKNQGRMYRNERTPDGNRAGPDGSISEEQNEID